MTAYHEEVSMEDPAPYVIAPPSVRHKRAADETTPLVRERWYVAARSDEITAALLPRRLLNREVLMYCTGDGRVVALDNRCPHRSMPLSKGRRAGDDVVCGYHGLAFAPDGRCIRVPTLKSVPRDLTIHSYPLIERPPLVWVWMGNPGYAAQERVPEHFDLSARGWEGVSNFTRIKANYVGLQENLQDLTHFTFLHGTSIGVAQFETVDLQVKVEGERVFTRRESRDLPPPIFWANTLPLRGEKIDRVITTTFKGPALCDGTMVITDRLTKQAYTAQVLHFVTPESERSTLYWWFVLRDFGIGNPAIAEKMLDGFTSTFNEDKEALESIEAMKARDYRSQFNERSFLADRAGMQMRFAIQKLSDAESS
jgi:phenylpropionate dioxygenase-like ring-hydroxylating dioxygenase large terminal subunit